MKYELKAELKMKATEALQKSVAADLLIPDPCEAHVSIPSGEQKTNESPKKHD